MLLDVRSRCMLPMTLVEMLFWERFSRTPGRAGRHAYSSTAVAQPLRLGLQGPGPICMDRMPGIDDWAWRRRQHYWPILMDLERRRVISLLPVLSADSVAEWLQSHARFKGSVSATRCLADVYVRVVDGAAIH